MVQNSETDRPRHGYTDEDNRRRKLRHRVRGGVQMRMKRMRRMRLCDRGRQGDQQGGGEHLHDNPLFLECAIGAAFVTTVINVVCKQASKGLIPRPRTKRHVPFGKNRARGVERGLD